MTDYTPSTEEVREQYWAASGDPRRDSQAWGEFDRWLRKVQSEAWEEGHQCDYIFDEDHVRFCGNPYQ